MKNLILICFLPVFLNAQFSSVREYVSLTSNNLQYHATKMIDGAESAIYTTDMCVISVSEEVGVVLPKREEFADSLITIYNKSFRNFIGQTSWIDGGFLITMRKNQVGRYFTITKYAYK